MSWYLMVERSELEHQTARGWQGANGGPVRLAPRVVRLDNADTGEIREWRPMTAAGTATSGLDSLIEAYDEYGGLCGKIARELGPEIARRWGDGDESLDLVAEVAALREAHEGTVLEAERARRVEEAVHEALNLIDRDAALAAGAILLRAVGP